MIARTELVHGGSPPTRWPFTIVERRGSEAAFPRVTMEGLNPAHRVVGVGTEGSVLFDGQAGPRHLPGTGTSRKPERFVAWAPRTFGSAPDAPAPAPARPRDRRRCG